MPVLGKVGLPNSAVTDGLGGAVETGFLESGLSDSELPAHGSKGRKPTTTLLTQLFLTLRSILLPMLLGSVSHSDGGETAVRCLGGGCR